MSIRFFESNDSTWSSSDTELTSPGLQSGTPKVDTSVTIDTSSFKDKYLIIRNVGYRYKYGASEMHHKGVKCYGATSTPVYSTKSGASSFTDFTYIAGADNWESY